MPRKSRTLTKIHIKDADGDTLNALVEMALGKHVFRMTTGELVCGTEQEVNMLASDELCCVHDFLSDATAAHDLIERHHIWTHTNTVDGSFNNSTNRPGLWEGVIQDGENESIRLRGPTHLIAALRTFAAWRLGFTVEIPWGINQHH